MIIPMIKYSFLIHYTDYARVLDDLKQLGVLHIIEHDKEPSASLLEGYRKIKEINLVARQLGNVKLSDNAPTNHIADGAELFETYQQNKQAAEHEKQKISHLQKELKQVQPWGNFDRDNITRLTDVGLKVCFYTVPIRQFNDKWTEDNALEIISDVEGIRYFVVIASRFHAVELPDAEEVRMPERSIDELSQLIDNATAEITRLKAQEEQMANGGIEVLKRFAASMQDALASTHAELNTLDEADGQAKLVEGWVPTNKESELIQLLESSDVLSLRGEKTSPADKPPILLKNNRFSKLFEPIGKLYSLPGYGEMDLTPFFAPFFMMFFGFCFGDAGYGLMLVIAGLIVRPRLKEEFKPLATLMIWLSLAAVVFGSLTGTLFGAKLTDFKALEGLKAYMVSDQQMFNLALGLGLIQIVFGMVVRVFNIIRQNGFSQTFSTIGWILVIVSSIAMAIMDKVDPAKGWMTGTLHLILLSIAGLGIFIFNDPKRNVFINIGAGLWDSYNMVTGVAGDVLSYIRLFALGLSSGILGMVFNQLAFNLTPDIPVLGQIVTALILIFGHSLNIFMSLLGSFVHPMRLTFVEFYKNAGFAGGGKAYSPFKKFS